MNLIHGRVYGIHVNTKEEKGFYKGVFNAESHAVLVRGENCNQPQEYRLRKIKITKEKQIVIFETEKVLLRGFNKDLANKILENRGL